MKVSDSVRTVEHGIRIEMITLGTGSSSCSVGSSNSSGRGIRRCGVCGTTLLHLMI